MDALTNDFGWMLCEHVPTPILMRFWQGGLDGDEAAVLESHILVCPMCQQQLIDVCIVAGVRRRLCVPGTHALAG